MWQQQLLTKSIESIYYTIDFFKLWRSYKTNGATLITVVITRFYRKFVNV